VNYTIPGLATDNGVDEMNSDDIIWWCMLNSTILIFTSLKLMAFARINGEFGKLA